MKRNPSTNFFPVISPTSNSATHPSRKKRDQRRISAYIYQMPTTPTSSSSSITTGQRSTGKHHGQHQDCAAALGSSALPRAALRRHGQGAAAAGRLPQPAARVAVLAPVVAGSRGGVARRRDGEALEARGARAGGGQGVGPRGQAAGAAGRRGVRAVRRVRDGGCRGGARALLLPCRGRRQRLGVQASAPLAQRRSGVLVAGVRRHGGAGPVPRDERRQDAIPQPLRVEPRGERAVPGEPRRRRVLVLQHNGGLQPERRQQDGGGRASVPPRMGGAVPRVQGPRVLHRRRELRRPLRAATRPRHPPPRRSRRQVRLAHQLQRHHDRERGDQRLDGRQGHVRLLLDARAHLRRDGGQHQQALQLHRRRLERALRRRHVGGQREPRGHRHLQHLRAQLPVRQPRLAADQTIDGEL